MDKMGKGFQARRRSRTKVWKCGVAWRIGTSDSTLWLVGAMDRGRHVQCGFRTQAPPESGAHASGGDLSTEPLFLCARASGFSWPAPARASSCSKRREMRATGKQPSLTVSASKPISPPDPGIWLPALGTADARHGQAGLTGPLSASPQLRVHH